MLGFLPTRAYRPGTPGATTFLSPLSGTFNYGWDSFGYALDRFLPGGDALQLMVGSEGTLGIVVGATLRLAPQAQKRGVLLVGLPFLASIPSACSAAAEANASACELFGRRLLDLAELAIDPLLRDVAKGAAAVVLLEGDQDQSGVGYGVPRTLGQRRRGGVGGCHRR